MPKYVQEFNGRLKGTVGPEEGSFIEYRSPYMSTMYSVPGKPAGSDRASCPTVNGFIQVKAIDKGILKGNGVGLVTTIWGESFGADGVITDLTGSGRGFSTPDSFDGDIITFTLLTTSGNLCNNVYIKLTAALEDPDTFSTTVPVDILIKGALLAYG
jgi:hypothetical protein